MNKFVKMDKNFMDEINDLDLFTGYAENLEDLMGEPYYLTANIDKVEGTPQCAKFVLYAWHFSCEVNSSGSIYDYIYFRDVSDEQLLNNLHAFKDIGCLDLATRYESGIKLAIQDKSFTDEGHNPAYFSNLVLIEKYDSFDKIDNNLYSISGESLSEHTASYIKIHKKELFRL